MFVSTKVLIACFAPLALAQYGPPAGGDTTSSTPPASTTKSSSATNTASSTPGSQTVVVGAGGLTFNPNSTTAAVGSTVVFQFPSTVGHSVVEGSFANPCFPANGSAFFSGGLSAATTNVFTITINDTNPIWYFCGAPGHCGLGMVGVINPPTTDTVDQFAAAAAKVTGAPSITLPVEGGTVGPAKAATTPPPSQSSTSSATTSSTSSASKSVAARGMETGGSIQWVLVAMTGMVALGFGSLIM